MQIKIWYDKETAWNIKIEGYFRHSDACLDLDSLSIEDTILITKRIMQSDDALYRREQEKRQFDGALYRRVEALEE